MQEREGLLANPTLRTSLSFFPRSSKSERAKDNVSANEKKPGPIPWRTSFAGSRSRDSDRSFAFAAFFILKNQSVRRANPSWLEVRPRVGTSLATSFAEKTRLNIGKPHVIRLLLGDIKEKFQ